MTTEEKVRLPKATERGTIVANIAIEGSYYISWRDRSCNWILCPHGDRLHR